MKILLPATDNGVTVVVPSPRLTPEEVVAQRNLQNYEIVDDSTIPGDDVFRSAWEWAGVGNPITIDLEKARAIALDLIQQIALKSASAANELTLLQQTGTYTVAQIRTAYLDCKSDLESATSVPELHMCLNTFESTYSIP